MIIAPYTHLFISNRSAEYIEKVLHRRYKHDDGQTTDVKTFSLTCVPINAHRTNKITRDFPLVLAMPLTRAGRWTVIYALVGVELAAFGGVYYIWNGLNRSQGAGTACNQHDQYVPIFILHPPNRLQKMDAPSSPKNIGK